MNLWHARYKVHSCWLIACMCFGFSVGVFVSKYFVNQNFFLLACGLTLICIVLYKKWVVLIPILIFGAFIIGVFRGSLTQSLLVNYEILYGNTVEIAGRVKEDTDLGFSDQLNIKLDDLQIGGNKYAGVVWVSTSSDRAIVRGDTVIVTGKLLRGFGNFSGVVYRAEIVSVIKPNFTDFALIFRDWFAEKIHSSIIEPESSLGIGFLLGQRTALPSDLIETLKLAGLTHIVVASGYNLTILVRIARRIFAKISKYLAVLTAAIMIISFIAITGLSPSMTRAGLVAGLCLLAWYYGRKFHPIVLLMIAIAITLSINPSYAWGDVGWSLSFAAFAGVMILSPLMQRYFFGEKKLSMIMQIFCETISAQIVTAPILIATFSQLSNVALISNILILPFVPLAMLLTFISGVGAILLPSIATIIGMPAYWLLSYMVGVSRYLADLPWATSIVNLSWFGVFVCYALIIAACIYMSYVTKFNLREANLVE